MATPVSVLREFSAPPPELRDDRDLHRERVQSAATGLLTLLGVEADPITSPEHILLSTVLDRAWRAGRSLDLPGLIAAVQQPDFDRVGVMELDSFFPPRERFALAMRMNNLLAAPGFEAWLDGVPLDIDGLLYTDEGKPRVSVMSIAHLGDAERMFFVTMLLAELIAWMRRQPGSGSLRAILYMDELFGYLPPVANPPSKALFLTLLKQARAFGLGLVLSTQNPVDLDYKALSNAGTWCIGRLQTERDKHRVREGLAGAAGSDHLPLDRLDEVLSGLGKRRFLLHNVHEREPVLMETRWVMSYLAGPLTREQLGRLRGPEQAPASPAAPATPAPSGVAKQRPVLDPALKQFFVDPLAHPAHGEQLVYYPRLLGAWETAYQNARLNLQERRTGVLVAEADPVTGTVDWDQAADSDLDLGALDHRPDPDAAFAEVTASLGDPRAHREWAQSLKRWLRANRPLVLYKSPALKVSSEPGESERDFRIRLQQLGNEQRDLKVARLRERYEKKVATLEDRLQRAQQAVERQAEQAKAQKLDAALSFGTAILGAVLGRKRVSTTSASRVGTAVRKAGRIGSEAGDVRRAQATVARVQQRLAELEAAFEADVDALEDAYDAQVEALKEQRINPRATDTQVRSFGLVWVPYVEDAEGRLRPA
jgi:hypothetical protein